MCYTICVDLRFLMLSFRFGVIFIHNQHNPLQFQRLFASEEFIN